jgi:excisionase family DNA binding protein
MEAINIKFEFTDEMLCQLKDTIRQCIAEEMAASRQSQKINLTRTEAAARLCVTTRHLDRLLEKGLIKYQLRGNRRLIPESEIESFLKQSA